MRHPAGATVRRNLSVAFSASIVLSLTTGSLAQPAGTGAHTPLRAVRIESTAKDGTVAVAIEANGPLAEPSSEPLDGPPRIYLDFHDVIAVATFEQVPSNPLVSRIRVAEHSSIPLVTRIVLDLRKQTPYRIDSSGRGQGRVVVILGGAERPSSRTSASSVAPKEPGTATNATLPRTSVAETQYAARVTAPLVRLQALRPLLEAIDRRADTGAENLDAAVKEFDDVAKVLTAIKPPAARASTHALLVRTCTMGSRAVRVRQSAPGSWEAASAAAGALMMLDKAKGELTLAREKVEGRR